MSKYKTIETQINNLDHLCRALDALGVPYETAQADELPLYGYRGDERAETGAVVVRREHIGRLSNDIGWTFNLQTGAYDLVLSEYDQSVRRALSIAQGAAQHCALYALHEAAAAQGFEVNIIAEGGVQRVQLGGLR